jgi:transposase-like protein
MAEIAKEVKLEILSKVKGGEPVLKVAKEYGVSDRTIYAWLKAGSDYSATALDNAKLRRENDQLKQIIGVLSLELDKSKKKSSRNN